jgi:hypothetical protein
MFLSDDFKTSKNIFYSFKGAGYGSICQRVEIKAGEGEIYCKMKENKSQYKK